MKKVLLFMVMMCIALVGFDASAQKKEDKKNNKEQVVFDVSMTCENCKKKIERNIPFEKGVSDMKVDLPAKTVMVVYQTNKTDQTKLQQAFEKLGYTATVHQDENVAK